MAKMKYLNARVQLKYDTLAKWTEKNPTLLAGELAIVSLGNSHTTTTPDNGTHAILFKVGPGAFNSLPFASALAADVYGWAKAETVELVEQTLTFKTGDNVIHTVDLSKFVTNEELTAILANYYTKSEIDKLIEDVEALIPSIPDVTATGDGEVILSAEGHHVSGSHAPHAAGEAKTASSAAISGYGATGEIKISKIVTNAAGHVTAISEETVSITMPDEQVFVDTNTITTVSGDGKYIKVERTDGENDTHDYKVSAIEDELKNLIGTVTTAAMDFKGVTASLPAEGVKGDMYKVTDTFIVDADNDAQGAGFTAKSGDSIVCDSDNKWYLIPSGDDVEDTWRHVKVNGEQVLDNGVDANKPLEIENGTDDAGKYAKFTVNGKVVKAEVVGYQEAGNYKTEQEAYVAEGSTVKTVTKVEQNKNGEVTITYENIAFPAAPVVNDGKFTVSGVGSLTGTGEMTANQAGDTVANLDIADKGVTTAKIADKAVTTAQINDKAVGAEQTKAYQATEPKTAADITSEEVWVFYCGTSDILV